MTSAGGLVRPEEFRAKDSLLSGPAGGVVGAARAGRRSGFPRVIAFDMGGTSTDVARFDGDFEYVWQHEVGGVQLLAPALAIESVAAGGGSICSLDANGLRVGPESAGARPGPACYGAGGPLTITDVNLLLGRLDPARFGIPISRAAAEEALEALRRAVEARDGGTVEAEPLLAGLLEIADERMADAIRGISLRKGYDPGRVRAGRLRRRGRAARLRGGGAAGDPHGARPRRRRAAERPRDRPRACWSASPSGRSCGVSRALAPPAGGRRCGGGGGGDRGVAGGAGGGGDGGGGGGGGAGGGGGGAAPHRQPALRGAGVHAGVEVEEEGSLRDAFELALPRGVRPPARGPPDRAGVAPRGRLLARGRRAAARRLPLPSTPSPAGRTRAWMGGGWREVPAFDRASLRPGARLSGPALVFERHSATVVEAGWEAAVDGAGALVLSSAAGASVVRRTPDPTTDDRRTGDPVDAVQEELFTSRFRALVGEMGEQLRRTALSTNVKERLDFSCALLDADAELVVNAPHIPVHLGALGLCVRQRARGAPAAARATWW